MSDSNYKPGMCEICWNENAKYTCPRCEIKSCSLPCVQFHKKAAGCDGKRDKLALKPIEKFTNYDLHSDYLILQEIIRHSDRCDQINSRLHTKEKPVLPKHLYKLKTAALIRGTYLLYLPRIFLKHQSNTTFYDWSKEIILWRVEWIFPHGNNIKCVDERVCENDKLAEHVQKYVDPAKCQESLRNYLQFYHSAGLGSCILLLQAEHVPTSEGSFHELDISLSLKENLKGKCIVEYPKIYVVFREHKHCYDVLDSDAEAELENNLKLEHEKIKNEEDSRKGVQKTKRKAKKESNFLFNNADSSSDEESNQDQKQHGRKFNTNKADAKKFIGKKGSRMKPWHKRGSRVNTDKNKDSETNASKVEIDDTKVKQALTDAKTVFSTIGRTVNTSTPHRRQNNLFNFV